MENPDEKSNSINNLIRDNANFIEKELERFKALLQLRAENIGSNPALEEKELPEENNEFKSGYLNFIKKLQLNFTDRMLLIACFAKSEWPELYMVPTKNGSKTNILNLSEFGGPSSKNALTLRAIIYLLAGDDIEARLHYRNYFNKHSALINQQIITLIEPHIENGHTPRHDKHLVLAEEYLNHLLHGTPPRPDFGKNFPATITSTQLNWDDLVVKPYVIKELNRISKWHKGGKQMIANSEGKINGSFPCLFYGSSGAGKTLAAQLLGKKLGVDVFRIDLSMVVSKYIGETEKNLAYLFDRAKGKNWILLFDEADALFGKRTDIKDSKDKWANLEMSYLLQRMEEHQGLTILTTNYRHNLDMALTRRFQSVLYFNRPDKEERLLLWQKLMPKPYCYPENVIYEGLAHYELTGADISNVIKAACLEAECRNSKEVNGEDLMDGIKREFAKENRSLN